MLPAKQPRWDGIFGQLDDAVGQILERATFGLYDAEYSTEPQDEMERVSCQAMRRNQQILDNFTTTHEQVVKELNRINFVEQLYPNCKPSEKEALNQRKLEMLEVLRKNTAQANASLYRLSE